MTKYIFILIAYLVGSIPFSYLLGKYIKKDDIRKKGSGNLGTTNAFRVFGAVIGVAVLVLDTLKSGLFVLIIRHTDWIQAEMFPSLIYGAVAVVGHVFPIWMKFKGGKGVASSFGLLIFYYWPIPIALLPVFIGTLLISKYASLASTLVAISIFITGLVLYTFGVIPNTINLLYVVVTGLLMLLILFKHRTNYARIYHGTENKIEFKKKKVKKDGLD